MKFQHEITIEIVLDPKMVERIKNTMKELNLDHLPLNKVMYQAFIGSMFLLEKRDKNMIDIVKMNTDLH